MSDTKRLDYSKYEVDELAETVSDAVFFPMYLGKVFGLVLAVFIVLLTLFAYFYISNTSLSILFWIIAFIISLPSVILFSVIRLFSTIQDDMEKVYEITLKTAKNAYTDGGLIKAQRQGDVPIKNTFSDVFKGVALFVVKPVLIRVLEKRIPYFSYPFVVIINSVFKKFVVKKSKTISENAFMEAPEKSEGNDTEKYALSDKTFSVFKFPFRLALVIYGFINFCLVYLLYKLFA